MIGRDYSIKPLRFREQICKEDLFDLYIIQNLSLTNISAYLKRNICTIHEWLKKYNIKKDKEAIKQSVINTWIKKYNISNPFKDTQKIQNAIQEKYKTINISQVQAIKDKKHQTKINNIDSNGLNSYQRGIINTKKGMLKKYGIDNIFRDKERMKRAYLEKLGVGHPSKLEEVKTKKRNIMLKKFGVDNIFKRKDIIKQAMVSKYGVSNPSQNVLIQNKKYETMKNNHSYNTSKKEEIVYNCLVNKFGSNNIVRQYKSKEYPFACDFYIKPIDLYIEYNGTWTHGKEPFDKNNIEHLTLLDKWKNKNTKYYKSAIKTWTIKDVQKLKTFQKHNLNYKIFYTIDEFNQWYETIK